jgi:DNA-binding winged helix-turn-helix (wHTH) protein
MISRSFPDTARRVVAIRRLPLPAAIPPVCARADQRPRAPQTAPLRVERGASQLPASRDRTALRQGHRAANATTPFDTNVRLLRWPAESAQRSRYEALGVLRLLVVEGQAPAPVCTDIREDWVRAPITDADLRVRVAALRARAEAYLLPQIDHTSGTLWFAERFVAVSPNETRLLECMIRQFGVVVPRSTLHECLPNRPGGASRNALDLRIMRLRRRIRPLDLVIRTVYGRGYLLEAANRQQLVEPQLWPRPQPATHQDRHVAPRPGGPPNGQLNGLEHPEHTAKVTPLRRRRAGHGAAIE